MVITLYMTSFFLRLLSIPGPCRMRKRLCRNHHFYDHYLHKDQPKLTAKSKYQHPGSFDSELFMKRAKLFQQPTLLATPTSSVTASYHDNMSLAISKVSSGGSLSGKGTCVCVSVSVCVCVCVWVCVWVCVCVCVCVGVGVGVCVCVCVCGCVILLFIFDNVLFTTDSSASATNPTPSPGHISSSNQLDAFNQFDSDNPVAQTLYRLIEPDDKV